MLSSTGNSGSSERAQFWSASRVKNEQTDMQWSLKLGTSSGVASGQKPRRGQSYTVREQWTTAKATDSLSLNVAGSLTILGVDGAVVKHNRTTLQSQAHYPRGLLLRPSQSTPGTSLLVATANRENDRVRRTYPSND